MQNELPYWVSVLSALATPTLAVVGSYIAWKQHQTAREKIKLDLFDKRFVQFEEYSNAMLIIIRDMDAENETLRTLARISHVAPLLFPDKIAKKIEATRHKAVRLNSLNKKLLHHNLNSDERTAIAYEVNEIVSEFNTYVENLADEFKSFMRPLH